MSSEFTLSSAPAIAPPQDALSDYEVGDFFDEMFTAGGKPRSVCGPLVQQLRQLSSAELASRQFAAKRAMLRRGITFNVYGDEEGSERIIPFDVVPRIVARQDWQRIEQGLKQRISALNAFLADIYGSQHIVRDGVLPRHLIETSAGFRQSCVGLAPPRGIWCHIVGTDLVRDRDGQFLVLEDNLRCPSGVSYVLQNRELMKQTFAELFAEMRIEPVDDYCSRLLDALQFTMEDRVDTPKAVLLTPGTYNSAYFEHSFLAQQMGIVVVEGRDLAVEDGILYVRTTQGVRRVDVVYRRIDDDFLDPHVFRDDSMLGVPGLMQAYRDGNVALANAPGTGVADDKVIYTYVPDFIRYYLSQDPILPNVATFCCWEETQRQHVLKKLSDLVVKPVNESGGYGLMIGPHASAAERERMAQRIQADPRNYIAQPTLSLSRSPVATETGLAGRHVDLRPFIINGRDLFVLPGGLTRVALQPGSLVVNSSQGGGSKDTWVVA